MTKARMTVLEVVEQEGSPLSARQIGARIAGHDTATVYRALHYLEEKGLIESFILHCDRHGTERYYTAGGACHRHWFHCVECHRFIDLGECVVGDMIEKIGRQKGLAVTGHTFFATGLCAECQAAVKLPGRLLSDTTSTHTD